MLRFFRVLRAVVAVTMVAVLAGCVAYPYNPGYGYGYGHRPHHNHGYYRGW